MTKAVETGVSHCARCGKDHKDKIIFKEFLRPIVDSDGTVWNYWGKCPNSGEPILLKITNEDNGK